MSESQPKGSESKLEHHTEQQHTPESHSPRVEHQPAEHERNHGTPEHVENLQRSIDSLSTKAERYNQQLESHNDDNNQAHPIFISKHLKDVTFTRTMTRTRKHLSGPARGFSTIIHAPIIDRSSELVGKTIARPLSMMSGAIVAFVGTSALLWITKYYGYQYNYLAVILLFIIGMVVGLFLELTWRSFRKLK